MLCKKANTCFYYMKTLVLAGLTAAGKTTISYELEKRLPNVTTLHFDDYSYEGEVEDFYKWTIEGADFNVWKLEPLVKDVIRLKESGKYDWLILDFPFGYCHDEMKDYIDYVVYVDIPLDVTLARRIIRDMPNATGNEIREELELYVKYGRIAFLETSKQVLPSADCVVDGTKPVAESIEKIMNFVSK